MCGVSRSVHPKCLCVRYLTGGTHDAPRPWTTAPFDYAPPRRSAYGPPRDGYAEDLAMLRHTIQVSARSLASIQALNHGSPWSRTR